MFNFNLLAAVTVAVAVQGTLGVAVYGQCGGKGYTGSTVCDSGSVCTFSNDYYSQCLPGSGGTTAPATTGSPTTTASPSTGTSLNSKFQSHGKKFWGAAMDPGTLSIAASTTILKREFGGVSPENSMKWDATESTRGKFTFSTADQLVSFAQQNNMFVRGHTLLWHNQLPNWVSSIGDRTTLTSVIQTHASTVAGHFKGKIYAWDVVNEMFNDDSTGSVRTSVFSKLMGTDFVAVAFQAAKSADPAAIRYINDYNLEYSAAKRNSLIALVNKVNAANPGLIQGIGTQSHLSAGGGSSVKAALTAMAAAGVDVAITELDIRGASSNDYVTVVKACLSEPKCVSITTWGLSDKNSWIQGVSGGVLLWDDQYKPKAAYSAVMAAL